MTTRARWTGLFLLTGLVAGCAGRHGSDPAGMAGLSYPDWVTKGSGAFEDGRARVFYGVGQVSGIKNQALARTTADNRARAEIARTFETYSASLMRDYAASTHGDDPQAVAEEQQVEQAIKTFTAASLSGVQIVDHWFHPSDGTIFSLARLDLDGFVEGIGRMQGLEDSVRDYVRKNAANLHDRLTQEEARHRAGEAPATAAPVAPPPAAAVPPGPAASGAAPAVAP